MTNSTVINIPFHPGQMTYGQFIDFKKEEEFYHNLNVDDKEMSVEEHLISAVSHIVGDCSDIPFNIKGDSIRSMIDSSFMLLPGKEVSVMRIYAHIINLMNNFKLELSEGKNLIDRSYCVEYEGEKYYIDPDSLDRNFGYERPFKTGEVLEAKSLERELNNLSKLRTANPIKDMDGGIEFGLDMKILAIIMRKKGEKLPVQYRERKRFLTERAKLFSGLPMDVVLGVRFFFQSTLEGYVKTQILWLLSLGKNQRYPRLTQAEKRKQKSTGKMKR